MRAACKGAPKGRRACRRDRVARPRPVAGRPRKGHGDREGPQEEAGASGQVRRLVERARKGPRGRHGRPVPDRAASRPVEGADPHRHGVRARRQGPGRQGRRVLRGRVRGRPRVGRGPVQGRNGPAGGRRVRQGGEAVRGGGQDERRPGPAAGGHGLRAVRQVDGRGRPARRGGRRARGGGAARSVACPRVRQGARRVRGRRAAGRGRGGGRRAGRDAAAGRAVCERRQVVPEGRRRGRRGGGRGGGPRLRQVRPRPLGEKKAGRGGCMP